MSVASDLKVKSAGGAEVSLEDVICDASEFVAMLTEGGKAEYFVRGAQLIYLLALLAEKLAEARRDDLDSIFSRLKTLEDRQPVLAKSRDPHPTWHCGLCGECNIPAYSAECSSCCTPRASAESTHAVPAWTGIDIIEPATVAEDDTPKIDYEALNRVDVIRDLLNLSADCEPARSNAVAFLTLRCDTDGAREQGRVLGRAEIVQELIDARALRAELLEDFPR